MSLELQLKNRLGDHRIQLLQNPLHPEQQIAHVFLELETPVTLVMTYGLSDYSMPVSEKWKGHEHTELFFCLPTYWDFEDIENPHFNWVYDWIFRLEQFAKERNTWFGPGHTLPCGNPAVQLSPTMLQNQFFFIEPLFVKQAMQPLKVGDRTVHFLAIVPIFSDELDYKMGKSAANLVRKLIGKKSDERLDDYRVSTMRSRFSFFKR